MSFLKSLSIVSLLVHYTFHEAHELIPVDLAVSVTINFLEECFDNWLIKSSVESNNWEGWFSQIYNLLPFKVTRLIFVVLNPKIVDNCYPLFIGRLTIGTLCLNDLSSCGLIILVGSVITNLVLTHMLIHIFFRILILFFLNRLDGSLVVLVVLVVLVMAWVVELCVFMLFLHDLVHENRLVYTLRRVKTRCALAVPLELVLAAQNDCAKQIQGDYLARFKLTYS